LEGVYQDLRELPFGDCDLWLYTSEWDGVPNMLIEVAALGVPLVGSIAGGTADILRSGLCERVEPIEDIDEYIRGINRILLDPVTAQLHADALREMVLRERSSETYRSDLERFLAGSSVA
jgi:glycosyltransferase involved in cell wall biosynthesis